MRVLYHFRHAFHINKVSSERLLSKRVTRLNATITRAAYNDEKYRNRRRGQSMPKNRYKKLLTESEFR